MTSANTELEAMRAENAQLRAQIATLLTKVARLTDQVSELLVIAQRKRRGAERPPKAPEPTPDLPEEAATAFEGRPTLPEPVEKPKPEPKPRKPTGRKPLPEHLPADTSVLTPEACSCCSGRNLEIVDEVVEEKLTVVAAHQRRRVVHRKTARCRDCLGRTTAEAPPAPFERSKVTCDWLAWLFVQKFVLLVPLDRIRRYLGAQGVVLSISFYVSQIEALAELFDAVDGEHWRQLLIGDMLASDATGLKVLIPKLGAHHGHIEVYHWDGLVVFQYEAEKGGETQQSKLARFRGTLLVDAESRYNATFRREDVIEAGCNAHGRRKFRDAEEVQPKLAAEGARFISAMFESDDEARKQGLVGEARRAWRQREIAPLAATFRKWMEAVDPTLVPSDPLAKAIRYYRNHWDALMRFLEDPRLPLDNSASEREFQAVAKLRLNCLFAGGTEGAHRAAVLLGIAATCRRLGLDVQAYATWALERLGTHRTKFALPVAQLTPAAYKHALAR